MDLIVTLLLFYFDTTHTHVDMCAHIYMCVRVGVCVCVCVCLCKRVFMCVSTP